MRHRAAEPDINAEVEALAAAAAHGDEAAMGELFERYVDAIYRYVHVRTRGNHADTEDVCSQVWIRVVRAMPDYTPSGNGFPAWLYTIARNGVKDFYRRNAARPETPTEDMLNINCPSIEVGPEEAAIRQDVAAQLAKAMSNLPTKQQQCVTLRFFEGLTIAETASVMGMTVGNVKVTQHRALKMLAKVLPAEMRILGAGLSVSHVQVAGRVSSPQPATR